MRARLRNALDRSGVLRSISRRPLLSDAVMYLGHAVELERRRQLPGAAGPGNAEAAAQEQMLELFRSIEPVDVVDAVWVRVGGANDGGYVMVDDLDGIAGALSVGTGPDVSWDLDVAERGIQVTQWDHTIPAPPERHPACTFHRIGVAPTGATSEVLWTLERMVQESSFVAGDLWLNLDVEGAEWSVLADVESRVLSRFRQVVVEFHDLAVLDGPELVEARRALENLAATHAAVHVHANNYWPPVLVGNLAVPPALEVTFVRRDAYDFAPCTRVFPTELDAPNHPVRPDVPLGQFRFA